MGKCCCVTVGWIHRIYFYLHSFLRSTAAFSEITQTWRRGATETVHTGRPFKQARNEARWTQWPWSNCPEHNFRTLYLSIYNIFPYFLYILNICLNVVTSCSKNRGLLWLCGGGGRRGSNYILERCLHISKSYVSCLGQSMTLYFIYLLISWSQVFTFSIRNLKKTTPMCCCRGQFRGIFVLFLPCTLLYRSIYRDFYLYMCKRPILRVSLWTEQSACGGRGVFCTDRQAQLNNWRVSSITPMCASQPWC